MEVPGEREHQLLEALDHMEEQGRLLAQDNQGVLKYKSPQTGQNRLEVQNLDQDLDALLVLMGQFIKRILLQVDQNVIKVEVDLRVEYWRRNCPQQRYLGDDLSKRHELVHLGDHIGVTFLDLLKLLLDLERKLLLVLSDSLV